MNVLMLSREYTPNVYGGAGIHVQELVKAIRNYEPGINPMVVTDRCDAEALFYDFDAFRIPFTKSNGARYGINIQGILGWCYEVISLNCEFDVIHCHTWYTLLAGVLLKHMCGKPLIITCHSLDINRPWKQEISHSMYNYSTWIEKTAYPEADIIIAVSDAVKGQLKKSRIINRGISVIPNGANHRAASPFLCISSFPELSEVRQPYALFVGRLSRQKGIDYLLKAVEASDTRIQYVICAGQADSDAIKNEFYGKYLELKKNGKSVIWIEEVYENNILCCLYQNASVYLNPAVYEPFGLTVVEALSYGVPIISSDVGGPAELLTDGFDSILLPIMRYKDRQSFSNRMAKATLALALDTNIREMMSQNALSTYSKLPTWEDVAHQHRALYETLQ
jgi:glycosyltransferase involved in cell wall biosynthesis